MSARTVGLAALSEADHILSVWAWKAKTEVLQAQRDELVAALRDLLEQIDCLDDISYSRDLEHYKAEANWNDVYDQACRVLKEIAP